MKYKDMKVTVTEVPGEISRVKAGMLAALVSGYFDSEEHRKAFAEWLEQRGRKAERA